MKKLLLSFLLILSFIFSYNFIFASECNVCTYSKGGCVVDNTTNNSANYGSICSCTGGDICVRNQAADSCKCAKAFGSGIESIGIESGMSTTSTLPAIIGQVIKVILGISGTVALIFVIWGGIKWMVSKGDQGKIGEARKLMTSGMIGIAIIAAAYAITDFVIKQITVVAGA